jgi:hypothetical protein
MTVRSNIGYCHANCLNLSKRSRAHRVDIQAHYWRTALRLTTRVGGQPLRCGGVVSVCGVVRVADGLADPATGGHLAAGGCGPLADLAELF